ncbi:hypothetical protein F4809DRAFT_641204 [Biscogniauxia mediterranea]|nr:hypothetical protein F4809DRAFT_641204 [Biscogniauxia mediterranea]
MDSQHLRGHQSDEEMVDAPDVVTEATPGQGGRGRGRSRGRGRGRGNPRGSGSGPASQPSRRGTITPQRPSSALMPPTPTPRRSIPIGHFPGGNLSHPRPVRPPPVAPAAPMELDTPGLLPLPLFQRLSQSGARPSTPPSGLVLRTTADRNTTTEGRRTKSTPQGAATSESSGHDDSPSPLQRATQSKQTKAQRTTATTSGRASPAGRARASSAASRGRASQGAGTPVVYRNLTPALPNITAQRQNSVAPQQPAVSGAGSFGSFYGTNISQQHEFNAELTSNAGFTGNAGSASAYSNNQAPNPAGGNAFGTGNELRSIAPAPSPRARSSSNGFPRSPVSFGLDAPNPVSAYIHITSPAARTNSQLRPSNNNNHNGQQQPHAGSGTPYSSTAPSDTGFYTTAGPATTAAAQAPVISSSYNRGTPAIGQAQQQPSQHQSGQQQSGQYQPSPHQSAQQQLSPRQSGQQQPSPHQSGQSGQSGSNGAAHPQINLNDEVLNFHLVGNSRMVSLPENINNGARTADNPHYYDTGFAPAFQIPPVPPNLDEPFWHTNPFARPGTWSAPRDPNLILPPTIYNALDNHMMSSGVLNEPDRMWIMGVQQGIGLGVLAYKESLMDELEIEGRLYGCAVQPTGGMGNSLAMRNKISTKACEYYDLMQAHKAAGKFIAASELLVQTIVEKGIEAALPPAGSFVATPALFPNNPEAQAHTNSLNAALASEINRPPPADIHAQTKPLVGPHAVADNLSEYEGVSQRGQARHGIIAPIIDNAINATRIPEGMRNFASAPAPDELIFTEADFREMREAAALEVASRTGTNNNNNNGSANGSAGDAEAARSGQQNQNLNQDLIGEVSSRTMGGYNHGAQPELSETADGHAFINVPHDK